MPTRGALAAEVAKAHMEQQMKWTVLRIMKTCLCNGTALYMVWSADDQKAHPKTNFVGNVRIATWHSVGVGVTTFIFKDNTVRNVRGTDIGKVIEVSNNIQSSRSQVHQAARLAAQQEPLCAGLASPFSDAEGEENEDSDEDKNVDENEDGDEDEDGDENGQCDDDEASDATTGALAAEVGTNAGPSTTVGNEIAFPRLPVPEIVERESESRVQWMLKRPP